MAIPRARGGTSPSTRWSPMCISSGDGRSSRAIMRNRVFFTEQEEASRTRNSPSRIDRSTPSTAWRSPKCFLRLRISMPATVGALAPGLTPVGRGVRRLRQVHRRAVNDAIRVLGHLQVLYHRRRGTGGRAGPPPGAPPAPHPPRGPPPGENDPPTQNGAATFLSFTQ